MYEQKSDCNPLSPGRTASTRRYVGQIADGKHRKCWKVFQDKNNKSVIFMLSHL